MPKQGGVTGRTLDNTVRNGSETTACSFGNQRILNFEVMVVRGITRRSRLSKKIHLSRDF